MSGEVQLPEPRYHCDYGDHTTPSFGRFQRAVTLASAQREALERFYQILAAFLHTLQPPASV